MNKEPVILMSWSKQENFPQYRIVAWSLTTKKEGEISSREYDWKLEHRKQDAMGEVSWQSVGMLDIAEALGALVEDLWTKELVPLGNVQFQTTWGEEHRIIKG